MSTSQSKPLILIVEDEKDLASMISDQLEMADMMTQVYHRGGNVVRFLKNNFANLMILDLNLPDISGFALLEELKKNNTQIPVIFLTASHSEVDKVKGLDMGGDDYITKPFSFPELIARIKAVLRRAETSKDYHITKNAALTEDSFLFCDAEVSPIRMEIVFADGSTEKIGRKELGILTYLVSNPNTVLTRRSLIHAVWGIHADVRSRSLDQYMVKIRDAFSRHKSSLDRFKTIHGVGFIYNGKKEQLPLKNVTV